MAKYSHKHYLFPKLKLNIPIFLTVNSISVLNSKRNLFCTMLQECYWINYTMTQKNVHKIWKSLFIWLSLNYFGINLSIKKPLWIDFYENLYFCTCLAFKPNWYTFNTKGMMTKKDLASEWRHVTILVLHFTAHVIFHFIYTLFVCLLKMV